ncbi:MAG: ParA family partition ATPase [Alphaproteobacteria bacterium]|jgi:chromosome partitioning protein
MAAIITFAQRKGGAGKTTLAAHLAAGWALAGRRVSAVDVDPQGSLARWGELRAALAGAAALPVAKVSGWRLALELERLRREAEIVVVDSPPHAELDARAAIRAADLVVIPVQPSPMDLWATQATVEMARAERRRALLVLNRIAPRTRLAQEIAAALGAGDVRLAATTLGNRTAFASSLAGGSSVEEEEPGGAAAGEALHLRAEIEEMLRDGAGRGA